jgi:hypothetical protein
MPLRRLVTAGASLRSQSWLRETAWTLAVALVSLLAVVVALRLWWANKHVPFWDANGDSLSLLAMVKAVIVNPWYWHIPQLGAPFGLNQYDYSSIFGDWLHYAMIKGLTLFSHDPALIFNTYLIAGFPLAAMSAFVVQRDLQVSRPVAAVTSIVFSVLPFHFATVTWLLTAYFAAPIAAWLVIIVALGRPVWSMHGRIPLPTMKVAIAALIVSGGSVYWTIFCAVLLVVVAPIIALIRTSWRPLLRGIMVLGTVAALALAAQAPALIYHARHGSNPLVGARLPVESESYGLTFAGLMIPPPSHPVPLLAHAGARWAATNILPGEADGFGWLWIGSLGSIGLLIGIGAVLRFGVREPRLLPIAGFLSLTALFVSWAGGISALIAWYVSPQIRAWDRIDVVIAFTSLLAVALVLDQIGRRINPKGFRRRRFVMGSSLVLLLALCVYDQVPEAPAGYSARAHYQALAATWISQTQYTAAVVAELPRKGAMVLQLPYVPFPEFGNRGTMIDYEQMRPFVQTNAPVKWSGASMKGRPTDWGPEMADWSTSELVVRAAAAGFDGIWLDHRAYPDSGAALISELSKALGGQTPFTSPDGTISYFDLRPLEHKEAALYTPEQIRALGDELVRPFIFNWGAGFQALEQDATASWRWLGANGTLTVHNPESVPWTVELRARAYRAVGTASATVSLVAPAACRRKFSVAAAGSPVDFKCKIPPGDTSLEFATTGPELPVDASQPQPDLHVHLRDPKLMPLIPHLSSAVESELVHSLHP